MEKKDKGNVTPINPTLNGGERREPRLSCGCDPDNAELDKKGNRMVVKSIQKPNFFAPLGAPDFGMELFWCYQCKEPLAFSMMEPPKQDDAEKPILYSPSGNQLM